MVKGTIGRKSKLLGVAGICARTRCRKESEEIIDCPRTDLSEYKELGEIVSLEI